jgi:hypothetical protein
MRFGEPTFKSAEYGLQIFSVNGNASLARKTYGIFISVPVNVTSGPIQPSQMRFI